MKYRETHTYKYKLTEKFEMLLPSEFSEYEADIPYLMLHGQILLIGGDYRWDGPSGPTIDSENFMTPSLVHDALYQLMREAWIPRDLRKRADQLLKDMCLNRGMSKIRAQWIYLGVRAGGGSSVKKVDYPVTEAP